MVKQLPKARVWRGGIKQQIAKRAEQQQQQQSDLQLVGVPSASASSSGSMTQWQGGVRQLVKKRHGAPRHQDSTPSAARDHLMLHIIKNDLPATQVRAMAEVAWASGARGMEQLALAGSSGWRTGNVARDLLRAAGVGKHEVPFYWAKVPVWSSEQGGLEDIMLPMLLPHELVPWFLKGHLELDPLAPGAAPWHAHFEWCCQQVGTRVEETVPLALWADGVPYTKRHSLFLLSLSFPALQVSKRLPLFVLSTQFLCKCGSCRLLSTVLALESCPCKYKLPWQ